VAFDYTSRLEADPAASYLYGPDIVHSRSDRRISISQCHKLAAAALAGGAKVQTWFPEQSRHLLTPALYPEEFERRLVGFFRQTLGD
jgi:hypothetical protein